MRRELLRPLALFWAVQGAGQVARAAMRGVAPELQAKYESGGRKFKCFNGQGEVALSSVNDDFCDCADGSDEPGTGACAGQDETLFHCANSGATPQLVYASRVDDGICDCCDGSDEAGLAARHPGATCANRCREEGERDLVERAGRLERLKVGLEKKAQITVNAQADRASLKTQLDSLKAELPQLEAVLEEAKKSHAEATADEDLRAEVTQLKSTVAELQKEVAELKAKCQVKSQAEVALPEAAAPAADVKPVVSEYAKWMEGAGSTPGAIDTSSQPDDESTAAGYEDMDDEDPGPLKPSDKVPSSGLSGASSAGAAAKSPAVQEAETKVKNNKDAARKLEEKLSKLNGELDGERLGYASLMDKCLSKHDGQYEYKLCFFNDAKQDHVSLGRWTGWTGSKEASFTNGQMCPGGPARDLKVLFECGSEEKVLDVSEPSRCSYQARVAHPGACIEADMAALEKPPVKHPKDEL